MCMNKSQHQSLQGEAAVASQGMCGKESQLSSFRKALFLSKKDYVILFHLSLLALVFVIAVGYIKPLEFFHVVSQEQLKAMFQENTHKTLLENLKDLTLAQFSLGGMSMAEFLRAAGWNGVWAFLCMMLQAIFGITGVLFPLVFVFHFILNRELKEMIQKLEKSSEQHDPIL